MKYLGQLKDLYKQARRAYRGQSLLADWRRTFVYDLLFTSLALPAATAIVLHNKDYMAGALLYILILCAFAMFLNPFAQNWHSKKHDYYNSAGEKIPIGSDEYWLTLEPYYTTKVSYGTSGKTKSATKKEDINYSFHDFCPRLPIVFLLVRLKRFFDGLKPVDEASPQTYLTIVTYWVGKMEKQKTESLEAIDKDVQEVQSRLNKINGLISALGENTSDVDDLGLVKLNLEEAMSKRDKFQSIIRDLEAKKSTCEETLRPFQELSGYLRTQLGFSQQIAMVDEGQFALEMSGQKLETITKSIDRLVKTADEARANLQNVATEAHANASAVRDIKLLTEPVEEQLEISSH